MYTGPKIVENGLVLYLDAGNPKSYPGTGSTWNDRTQNGNNGTLVNGVAFNGGNGGGMVFDGSNDYVEFGDILDLGTNSLTVNQWIRLSSISSQTFLSKSLAGAQNYRYSTGTSGPSNNRLAIFIQGNNPGADITPYGSTILTTNTWFMATYVFTRSSSISIYYNGVQETLTGNATISQWNGLNFQSTNPFRIGCYTTSNNIGTTSLTNGRIGITQVYFRALTAQEVLQNYEATKSRFGL